MPVLINNIAFTSSDKESLSKAFELILQLPSILINLTPQANPEKTVTILQRENAFLFDSTQYEYIFTRNLDTCILTIFTPDERNNAFACFASHVDSSTNYCWDEQFSKMQGYSINIDLIGGIINDKHSEINIKNILTELISISNKYNIVFTIKQQRVLHHFMHEVENYPFSITEYVHEKAEIVFNQLFSKSLPDEVIQLSFPDNIIHKNPTFEKFYETMENVKKVIAPDGKNNPTIEAKAQSMSSIITRFPTKPIHFFNFAGFLFSAGNYLPQEKFLFESCTSLFAPSEEEFIKNLKILFNHERAGFDTLTFALTINHSLQKTKFPFVSYNLKTQTLSPESFRFPLTLHEKIRDAKIYDHDLNYHLSFDQRRGGYQSPPTFSSHTIEKFKRSSSHFSASNYAQSLSPETINEIQTAFSIGTGLSSTRKLIRTLVYFASNPQEFSVLDSQPTNISRGFFNKSVNNNTASQTVTGERQIQYLNRITNKTFILTQKENKPCAIYHCQSEGEANSLRDELNEYGITTGVANGNIVEIEKITQYNKQLLEAYNARKSLIQKRN